MSTLTNSKTNNMPDRQAMTKDELLAELSTAEEAQVALERLIESQQFSLSLFRESERVGSIGHWEWDMEDDRLIRCSEEYASILGRTVDEIIKLSTDIEHDIGLVHPDDQDHYRATLANEERGGSLDVDYRIVRPDGEIRHIHERSLPLKDDTGSRTGLFGTVQDITDRKSTERRLEHAHKNLENIVSMRTRELADTVKELEGEITTRREMEEELQRLANHDPLTGLPSLRLCRDRLENAIAFTRRNDQPTALMFIDLDGFKAVNDTLGHNVGDAVLIETARRLQNEIRETDTVARMGGDEFVIILASMKAPFNAKRVALAVLKSLSNPFDGVDVGSMPIGASIGIAISPLDAIDSEELLKKADEAMYKVKRKGKNGFEFFSTDLPESMADE
jgi:diguanylate cyclase (GGDEF)-like protein/PAS domain S-box-containing protein